jgi:hypothetical protein
MYVGYIPTGDVNDLLALDYVLSAVSNEDYNGLLGLLGAFNGAHPDAAGLALEAILESDCEEKAKEAIESCKYLVSWAGSTELQKYMADIIWNAQGYSTANITEMLGYFAEPGAKFSNELAEYLHMRLCESSQYEEAERFLELGRLKNLAPIERMRELRQSYLKGDFVQIYKLGITADKAEPVLTAADMLEYRPNGKSAELKSAVLLSLHEKMDYMQPHLDEILKHYECYDIGRYEALKKNMQIKS